MFGNAEKRLKKVRNQGGFSILESVAGMVIMLMLLGGSTSGFLGLTQKNRQNQVRGDAIAAGRQVIDALRLVNPTAMPDNNNTETQTINIDGKDYEVLVTYCPASAAVDFCTNPSRRHIQVDVTYAGDSRVYYTTETVFTEL
ncbi:MAG: hypothetical protein AB4040_10085 [Synechococcus sp.]